MFNPEVLFSDNENVITSDESDSSTGFRQIQTRTSKKAQPITPSFETIDVSVSSEIGKLNKVLVHRPNLGHARIAPKDAEDLLFDDIVYLPQMQKEHDVFTSVLKAFVGRENVIEVRNLVVEALKNHKESRDELIERVTEVSGLSFNVHEKLSSLGNEELVDTVITGYSSSFGADLMGPIPNFIFTRDIAVTINDHVLVTKAAKNARKRE